jgi:hypothetical protein
MSRFKPGYHIHVGTIVAWIFEYSIVKSYLPVHTIPIVANSLNENVLLYNISVLSIMHMEILQLLLSE